jgi:ferric-dicitrate binding protein FerR (iron transport regulator)
MDRRKVEQFFKDKCTSVEAKKVKAWFKTSEGQAFLEEKVGQDIQRLQDGSIKPMTSEERSKKMWDAIEEGTHAGDKYSNYKSKRTFSSYWQVAAAVILLLVSATYYATLQTSGQEKKSNQPITYMAGSNEQKALTLSDGTKIRLNGNSKMRIPADFNQSTREVRLEGEAFFKVEDDEKPFIVHTDLATVKDLGTAFNVRTNPQKQYMEVAVTDGKISVWSDDQREETATQLVEGQFGHLDLHKGVLQIEQFGVQNYLSWMNGRLAYDKAPLDKVSRQLSRIYGASFSYSHVSLKELTLTTDFERKSLNKILEVIAMTLRIDYQIKGKEVIWLQKHHNADNNEYQR